MTCDPYLKARMNSTACEMAEILSKNYQNLFRSEAFYRRFIISAPASIKPKSVQNTDFVTQLGKWISAVPEPFRMKFSKNVEKLFPKFKFVSDLNYLLLFRSYCRNSESTREILTKFLLFLAFFSARWRPKNFKTTGLFKLH